jgi:cytochrome c2
MAGVFRSVCVGLAVAVAAVAIPLSVSAGPATGQSGDPVKGMKIYADQKCSVCHRVGSTGGKMGPDLSDIGNKRDAAWLAKYLADPKAQDPKNKMPAVKAKGKDLDDLVAYMLSLKLKASH